MGTTLRPRRPSNLLGKRFARALLMAALVGVVMASPAAALLPTGVLPPGGQVTDPCANTFPSILNFTATPSTVTLGAGTTLNWRVQFPNNCSFTVYLGPGPVNPQGTATVQPLDTSIYTLTVRWGRNFGRSFGVTTQVTVDLPKDPTDPTGVRNLVTISSQQMVSMFVRALGTPNTTVIVNADLDLTGLPPVPGFDSRILITDGVVLQGWRSAVPGQPFLPGPRLFVTDLPSPLFEIQGDNVRVTGVRIQGPSMQADGTFAVGMHITDVKPCLNAQPATPECLAPSAPGHVRVQIDHNEFSGWTDTALGVSDPHVRILIPVHIVTPTDLVYYANPTTEPVWIHDNFFHHNLHSGTAGYAVGVGNGAHALIERNVFDNNRHAITSGHSDDRVGYRAYRNLVLGGSGEQQFDMHGSIGCGTWHSSSSSWWCGIAGHDFDVRYNSFLYKNGAAVQLRGTPTLGLPQGAIMRFNVFAHDHETDAVKWTEGAPTVQDNLTGRTSYPPASTPCDFDGDGIKDTFIATEQTLWYCPGPSDCVTAPGSGKPTWVYLNSSPKRVDQLSLGHFSGGATCDVVDGGWISVGGSGPWIPLTPLGPGRGGVRPIAPSAGVSQ
jgi:hypothetical protein